jgi:hypothetical protein
VLCFVLDLPRAEVTRRAGLDIEAAQEAAERARALSDPTRLMLADALRKGGELCVCDLAWISERAQNLVSHHLRVLRSLSRPRHLLAGWQARHVLAHGRGTLAPGARAR